MFYAALLRGCRWLLAAATGLLPLAARAQQPVIRRVYVTNDPGQDSVFQLGSTIALEVTGLNRWLRLQEALLVTQGFDPQKAHDKARNLVLYVGDAPLLSLPPLALYVNESAADRALASSLQAATRQADARPDSAHLSPLAPHLAALLAEYPSGMPDRILFKLERNVTNYRYWNVVYDSPWRAAYVGKLGLGYADRLFTKLHPNQPDSNIRIQLIDRLTLWTALLGTVALALGLLVLGARSWLLRITPPRPSRTAPMPTLAEANPPFSLAKVQMAWWTFIILGSFLVIYCVSGEVPDISTTSLALLGISGGTAALNGLIRRNPPPPAATTGPWLASRGWLTDVLSDAHGVSMNRLQQVVIALLMGYFFVRTVYDSVAMPVWTDNQVLLLSVSSATYLGLEWQGSRTRDDPAGAGHEPAPAAAQITASVPATTPATVTVSTSAQAAPVPLPPEPGPESPAAAPPATADPNVAMPTA